MHGHAGASSAATQPSSGPIAATARSTPSTADLTPTNATNATNAASAAAVVLLENLVQQLPTTLQLDLVQNRLRLHKLQAIRHR
jgi:hypothetical protein